MGKRRSLLLNEIAIIIYISFASSIIALGENFTFVKSASFCNIKVLDRPPCVTDHNAGVKLIVGEPTCGSNLVPHGLLDYPPVCDRIGGHSF